MNWQDIDIKILIVSLPRSTDRRARLTTRFDVSEIAFRFIDAIDGMQKETIEDAFDCDPQSGNLVYEHRDRLVSHAELACTLSHLEAIYEAHVMGNRYTIICEDDVEFLDVTPREFAAILKQLPDDAGHLQLCVSPERTVERLSQHFFDTGEAMLTRSKTKPNRLSEAKFAKYPAHCATAYVITAKGARRIVQTCFRNGRIVLPCDPKTLHTNAGLLADRLIYRLSQDETINGYVHTYPTFSYEAIDSLLHPDHIAEHKKAKRTALSQRERLKTVIRN